MTALHALVARPARRRLAVALGLFASVLPAPAQGFFTIDSAIAVVADDALVAAPLQEALRRRFRQLRNYPSLAAAQESARGESGPAVALVVSSATRQSSAEAYGTALSSCQVQVTVEVLRLPAGTFEFSRNADGRAPDCAQAVAAASGRLSDELVKSLESYRRQGAGREKTFLWVELAEPWSAEELASLSAALRAIPGIRKVAGDAGGRELRLEVYREARALAREVDRLAAVKLTRFAGDRMTLARRDPSRTASRAGLSAARPAPENAAAARPAPENAAAARPAPENAAAAPPSTPARRARIPHASGRKYALIVGISTFRDPTVPALSFPVKDATAFARVLADRDVGRFARDDVLVLLDGDATTRRIKSELDRLARLTKPEDLFLFYFSSHAVPGIHDAAGDAYLVTHDTEKTHLYATGLAMRELVDALTSRIRARNVVSFLDACNTGQIVDRSLPIFQGAKALEYEPGAAAPPAGPAPPALSWSREWQALAGSAGPKTTHPVPSGPSRASRETPSPGEPELEKRVVFISSSDGDQPSWESEGLGHGFFTYYLMDLLARSRGQATVQSIFDDLRTAVKRAVKTEKGALQEPRMFFTHDADVVVGYPLDHAPR